MNITSHLWPKEVFLENVNGLVDPKMAGSTSSMDFFDKKLSNRSLWDTKFVTLEPEALLKSIRAMFAALLIIEVGLEMLILLVEITDELEA